MASAVETSQFMPVGEIDGGDEEETGLLNRLAEEAETYVRSLSWAPPVERMFLAFGVGGVLGLFLVRFARPIGRPPKQEFWVVVGDVPSAYAGVDDLRTPAEALDMYCCAMEGWANQVLSGGDLSQAYPVQAEPTEEHARMLLSRIEFIRQEFIPHANDGPLLPDDPDEADDAGAAPG